MTYSEVIEILSKNIINYFDEVYHSAELIINDAGQKIPAIQKGTSDEWIGLAPTDQRETIYIRRNGDDEIVSELKAGSCMKAYNMRSQLRVVFFRDNAKSEAEILFKLLQSSLTAHTRINKIIRDKWKLLKEESTGDYTFGATSVYLAIDIYILWVLNPTICEQDFCSPVENPLKKLCPAAV